MVNVVGVRFKQAGKIYYFDPGMLEIKRGDHVIVETARGLEYGEIVASKKQVTEKEVVAPLKSVIRIATSEDNAKFEENNLKKERALELCKEKVEKHDLDMKLIDVEYTFDNSKIIFYFTADGRVDFRDLVKDLAAVFKMRIELRQIGVRDEAKMIGGLGTCGKDLCCHSWLPDFEPVSIKMAKIQNLSLNPTKISGICGRLMCCLKYENDTYNLIRKELPDIGERVQTNIGYGIVTDTNILMESVKVRMILEEKKADESEKMSPDLLTFKIAEIKRLGGGKKKSKEKDVLDEIDDAILEDIKVLLEE